MRGARVLAVALAGLLLAGCRDGPDWRVLQLYGGKGSVEALVEPARVQVFRIDPAPSPPEPGVAHVGLHRVTGGPRDVPADVVAELSALLVSADTYDWRHAKGDPFLPTYGLRFARDVRQVDVAVDLESRMLTTHRHGRRVGVEDFDAAAPRLAEILRQLLPDDGE